MQERIKYKNAWHYTLVDEEVTYTFHTAIHAGHMINENCSSCTKCKQPSCYHEETFLFCICASKVIVRKGYSWDGASGPTIDTRNSMRATLIHDVLYQAMREGGLSLMARKWADKEFLRILENDGMHWLRRWYWYLGVRWFGGPSAEPF